MELALFFWKGQEKKKSTGSTILTYLKKSNSGLIQPNMAELFFQGVEGHITS